MVKTNRVTEGIAKDQHVAPVVDCTTGKYTLDGSYIEDLRTKAIVNGLKELSKGELLCLYPEAFGDKNMDGISKPDCVKMVVEWQNGGVTRGQMRDNNWVLATMFKGLIKSQITQVNEKIDVETKAIKTSVAKVKDELKKEKNQRQQDDEARRVIIFKGDQFPQEVEDDQAALKAEFVTILKPYQDQRILESKHFNYIRPLGVRDQNRRYKIIMRTESWRDDICAEAALAGDTRIKRGKTVLQVTISRNIYLANTQVHIYNTSSDGTKYAATVKNEGEFSRTMPYVVKYFDPTAPEVQEVVKQIREKTFQPFEGPEPEGLDAFH